MVQRRGEEMYGKDTAKLIKGRMGYSQVGTCVKVSNDKNIQVYDKYVASDCHP